MRLLSIITLTFAVLLGVSFAILNAGFVTVHYYVGTKSLPLSLLILGAWIFGIIVGLLISAFKIIGLRMELQRQHRVPR
ncbi:MAG TPA: LapA family protein [Gammaproteobacteria bacterium]|nr:LapA family protein [Gammaproteobacteria bacterium]HQZ87298.1 LapA family protein [Gammaproteobacteria bacterium]HRA42547.1 LapA family protein [Gammaproteobacteria bacterium]